MKRILKTFLIFTFTIILFSVGKNVDANTINKISMDIYIDKNGDAHITETWDCYANQGTEVYHPYYNLGNSQIKNLSVTEGSTKYTTLSKWNTSGTLSSKANKCGINRISNGVELCWGISSYGTHKYKVKYTITNFVLELTDSQMIYWTLIPYDFSNSIGNVYIKIYTDFNISNSTDVWGYGNYGGTAYVYNGYIEMQSDGRLATDEYMTILVKFPVGTFNTTNKLNKDFDYYFDMAEKGTKKYNQENNEFMGTFALMGMYALLIFVPLFTKKKKSIHSLNYGVEGKKIPRDVPYYRDIPCEKDIFKAYYIANQYKISKKNTDLLGAIILKWLKDGIIRIEQRETADIFKRENTVVVLNETDCESLTDDGEKELFRMLHNASNDGYLENKEFEKWCKKSYSKILSWFDKSIKNGEAKLIEEGKINIEDRLRFGTIRHKAYVATPELKQEALKLAGLKRYLKEYTMIEERQAIEVELFEEYLIYAQMLGIAKEVQRQFKELYPNVIEQSNFNSYDNIDFIYVCSRRGIDRAYSAKSQAEARARSYSSGGGGFSSGGGGGGSFGGGGGGGGFR